MTVRVRFAPSPTGYLHIGGARTALFNWLFARQQGGVFVLRIEDTDEVRSTQASVDAILKGMKWLGLDWDEGPTSATDHLAHKGDFGPYYQTKRTPLYKKCVDQLIQSGKAYPCYCTPEMVNQMREKARLEKRTPRYNGACRNLGPKEREKHKAQGQPFSVRFKSPEVGTIAFKDLVKGPLSFDNGVLEDFVIQKTSGIPTYNFACVVDDHEMKISHVLRGDDHMSNTHRQLAVCQALGWEAPEHAHLSMILGGDGSRLSKRHGATAVEEYQKAGYLPEALINYLALLGWSTEDSQQLFTRAELKEKFSLERCIKSAATFDQDKLLWMNGEYIRGLSPAELTERSMPFVLASGLIASPEDRREEVEKAVALEQEKYQLLTDVPGRIDVFLKDVVYDPASVEKVFKKEGVSNVLQGAIGSFESLEPFTAESTEQACRSLAKELGVKNGAVFHPVRVAVSGRTQGASLFHMLELLGKERCLERLKSIEEKLASGAL